MILKRLMVLSLIAIGVSYCGDDDDKPKNKQPPTAEDETKTEADSPKNPGDKKTETNPVGEKNPPSEPNNKTEIPPRTTPPLETTEESETETNKVRPITGEPLKSEWELVGADTDGDQWHFVVRSINRYALIASLDEAYSTRVESVRLQFDSNFVSPSSKNISQYTQAQRKSFVPPVWRTFTFKRDNITGECEATYNEDGSIYDFRIVMQGQCL